MQIPAGKARVEWVTRQVLAGTAIAAMGVPQGVAYAMIAGLPPVMGLYAGMLPAVVASLTRSSEHVVTGPTNAISLLCATSLAAVSDDPVQAAITMAALTGFMQIAGGVLRLKALVDYVSSSVVLGYITGAAVLIGVGQLRSVTGTPKVTGNIVEVLWWFASHVRSFDIASVVVGVGTMVAILYARRVLPKGTTELTVLASAALLVALTGADVRTVADLGGVPTQLPPLVMPDFSTWRALIPIAGAAAVLSMVESSSVARSIASRSGQRIDMTMEFVGQGLGNLASAVTGGYPVSGSLSRSALNERMGGSRLAGAISGVIAALAVMLVAPLLDRLPLPALGGLLLVVAKDLVEPQRIIRVLSSQLADRLAYVATVLGTWFLPLDQAIYLGVGISVVLFLRRSRHLMVHELRFDSEGHVHEVDPDEPLIAGSTCCAVKILNVEGPLFFGAANELDQVLADATADGKVHTLILRFRRTWGLDYTAANILITWYRRMKSDGRELIIVGVRDDMWRRMHAMGFLDIVGERVVFPTKSGWFQALRDALAYVHPPTCHADADHCPLGAYFHPDNVHTHDFGEAHGAFDTEEVMLVPLVGPK